MPRPGAGLPSTYARRGELGKDVEGKDVEGKNVLERASALLSPWGQGSYRGGVRHGRRVQPLRR